MKCLRCGYCCKNYMVVIVDDPSKGLDPNNLIVHEGHNTPCKHLVGDEPGKYSCSIHKFSWYKKTPCFQFTQIESGNRNCRMGEFVMKQKLNK